MKKDNEKRVPELRFKGFDGDWEQRKLGELTTRLKSYPLSRDVETDKNTGYRYIHYGDIHTRVADVIESEDVLPKILPGKYDTLQAGDLCLADASEDYQDIAAPSVLLSEHHDNIVAGLHTIALRPNGVNSLFLYFLFKAPDFRHYVYREGQGLKVFGISANNVLKYLNVFPSLIEQEKIVELLHGMDNTIALHERKLELLKKLKKAYLQQLFPENGSKVPKLRFAGFTNDWEQRKLEEIAKRITRKNASLQSELPLTISAQDGLVDQQTFFDKQVASKDVSGYYLIKKGEFAYNKSYSNGYPWGAIKRLNRYDMGVLSTLYIVFKPTNVSSDFLEQYFDSSRWYKEVSEHASEGARNHGLLNISPNDFFTIHLVIPGELNEQLEISEYLIMLNKTIALHQRKLESLHQLKKAYLQKLFV